MDTTAHGVIASALTVRGHSLRALLSRADLGLRLVTSEDEAPPGALDAPLRWVHTSDLADPTPFLTEGLALLTTGTQFPDGTPAEDYASYVGRLHGRGVMALGFGTEVVRHGVPEALAEACRMTGLPLFEVPYQTPFLAIARANAEAIAEESGARRMWTLGAHRAIARAALRPGGLAEVIAELSRQINAWVGLFDAAGVLSQRHPARGLDQETIADLRDAAKALMRRGARAASQAQLQNTRFTLQTLGRRGHLRGVLVLAAHGLDAEGRDVLASVTAMADLALEQSQAVIEAHRRIHASALRLLLAGDVAAARRVVQPIRRALPKEPVFIAVLAGTDTAAFDRVEARIGGGREGYFCGVVEGRMIVLTSAAGGAPDEIARAAGLRVGVSSAHGYSDLPQAMDEAAAAAECGGGAGGVTRFDDIAAAQIEAILDTGASRALARSMLDPLLERDRRHPSSLVEAMRTWLSHDAHVDEAAAALGIHRHTMRARIAVAGELLGVDLDSFSTRAKLWMALRSLREDIAADH